MFTFAVVGRDESKWLATAVRQAHEAAQAGDQVWFVDSASSDDSAEVAASLGARVLRAPEGKGRAIGQALSEAMTEYVVLVDADIHRASANIPLALRDAAERSGADLVVAEFEEPGIRIRRSARYVWRPLVQTLFPGAYRRFGRTPLSGFRAIRTGVDLGRVPTGFGAEAHINLAVAAGGGMIELVDVGIYQGPIRRKPLLGLEVGAAILDLAQALGRLDAELRPQWNEWVEGVVEVVLKAPAGLTDAPTPPDAITEPEYVERLETVASRPLPPTRAPQRAQSTH